MQCLLYFYHYQQDQLWIKLLVAFLWVNGTASQACMVAGLYDLLLVQYGDFAAITSAPLGLVWVILPSVCTLAGTQFFFMHRLWKFSGRKIFLPIVVIPTIVLEVVLHIMYLRLSLANLSVSPLHTDWKLGLSLNAVTVTTDMCLTLGMIYLLLKERVRSPNLGRMVFWLAVFTVNSGIWTSLAAFAVLITISVLPPTNLVFAAIYLVTSSLYCNATLSNLNGRGFIRERGRGSVVLSSLQARGGISEEATDRHHSLNIDLRIPGTSYPDSSDTTNDSKDNEGCVTDKKEDPFPHTV